MKGSLTNRWFHTSPHVKPGIVLSIRSERQCNFQNCHDHGEDRQRKEYDESNLTPQANLDVP